jgi:hypothetical protein
VSGKDRKLSSASHGFGTGMVQPKNQTHVGGHEGRGGKHGEEKKKQ